MKNSKLLIFLLAILMIVSISAVSAEDIANSTDLTSLQDDSTPLEVEDAIDDVQSDDGSSESLADPVEAGNFTSLQTLIDEGGNNATLEKDYVRVVDEKTIEINKNFTIDGQGKYTIDAKKLGGIFKVNTGTLTLKGLTLTNGVDSEQGAAVYVGSGAKLVADYVTFTENVAQFGGAISNYGTINIDHSVFTDNDYNKRNFVGGSAIYNENIAIINNTVFENNLKVKANRTNDDYMWGAISSMNGKLEVYNSNFTNNSGTHGGAISTWTEGTAVSTAVIDNCRFVNNTGYNGAAIYVSGSLLTVADSYFENNVVEGTGSSGATSGAGAILIIGSNGDNKITGSTFKNNKAIDGKGPAGGAVGIEDSTMAIDKCEFEGNTASHVGGAISISGKNPSDVKITESNFINNKANAGGAVYSTGAAKMAVSQSKFEGNDAKNGSAIYNEGALTVSNNTYGANDTIESETEVNKDGSNVTISPIENVTYGTPVVVYYKIVNRTDNVTVSVRLLVEGPQPDIENLNYTIDDEKVTIYDLGVGEYEIQIANIEDNNYDTSADIELFNITKANPNLKVTAKVNEFGIIEINVAGDKALTGNVTFKVINETGAVVSEGTEEIVNGTADFGELQTYAKGKYNYTVDFKDNKGNYNDTFIKSEIPLVVDKEIPELSVNTTVNEFGHIVVVANVTKGANGTINFLIIDSQGKQISVNKTLVNSTASYNELTPFAKGEYQVIVTYNGDNAYYSIFAKDVANVTKIAPAMDYTVKVVGGEVNITVTLPAAINGNLTVTYPSGFVENFTIKNGTANIYYVSMNKTGDLAITASFAGNDQYYAVEEIIGFTIKQATLIKVNPTVSVVYNNNAKVTVKLTNLVTNKVIAGATIEITVNGKNYKGTTDKDGKAVITIPAKMVPKKYTANVAFKGTDKLEADINQFKLTVKKATPKVTAKKKTFKKSIKVKKYAIALKDNKGKAIKKAKVTIKVGKKTFKATTNSKGKAVFKLKKLTKKAKYNAKVTYKGNKYFNKVTKKVKITLK